jgi:hypothetical protein
VLDFGFPDHHSPPLEQLFRIVASMHEFLKQDPCNVAVVHCIGGKGRTGTVIACYLAYAGIFEDTQSALQHFASMRSAKEKGVTQPSQKRFIRFVTYYLLTVNRYTQYFNLVLSQKFRPYPRTLLLKRIVMRPVPNLSCNSLSPNISCKKIAGCRPVVYVYSTEVYPKELRFSSWTPEQEDAPK